MQEVNFSNKIQQDSELVKYLFIKYYLWMTHAMPNSKFKEMDNRGGIAANVINKTLVSNTLGVLGSAALTVATGGTLLPLFVGSAITSVTNVVAPVLIDKLSNKAKVGLEKLSDDNMDPIKIAYTLGTENLRLFFQDYYPEQYEHILKEYDKIKEPKLFPDDGIDMFIKCIYILDTSDGNLVSKHSLKANLTEFIKKATVENNDGELVPCIDLYDTINPIEDMLNKGILDQDSFNLYVQYIDFVINQYYFEENKRIKNLPVFSGERIKSFFTSIFYEKTRSRFVKKSNARGFFGNIGVSTIFSTATGSILDSFLGGTFGTIVNKFASTTTGLIASNGTSSIYQETRFRKNNSYVSKKITQLSDYQAIQLSKKMSETIKKSYELHNITEDDNDKRIKNSSRIRFFLSRGNILSIFSKNSLKKSSEEIAYRNFYHFCLDKNFMTVKQMEEAEMFIEALKTGDVETDYMYLYKNTMGEFEPEVMDLIMRAQVNKMFLGEEVDNSVVVSIGAIFTPAKLSEEEKSRFGGKSIFKFSITSLMNDNLSLFDFSSIAVGDFIYIEAASPFEAMYNANLGRNIFGYYRKKNSFTYVSDYARTIQGKPEIFVKNVKNKYIKANTMTPAKIKCIEEKQKENPEDDDKKKKEKSEKEEPKKSSESNVPELKDSKEVVQKRTDPEKQKETKKEHRTAAAKTSTVPAKPLPEIPAKKEENEEVKKEEEVEKKESEEEIKKQIAEGQRKFSVENQKEMTKVLNISNPTGLERF